MTHALAGKVKEVHAVDIAPSMIEQARTLHAGLPNAHFHVGSGADLALFPDASFDFVFSFIVLQHVPDPDVVLGYIREFGRVLRPGGRALFQLRTHPETPDQTPPPSFDSAMVELLFGSGYDSPAWIGSTLHMGEVREAIDRAGMRLVDVDGVGSQYTWLHCTR
jgi:ubiquinone/menaquinone biosynthesis C-methylase UbiE